MIGQFELILSWLVGEETIDNVNFNQSFLQTLNNKAMLKEIRVHLTDLTTKHLTI